MVRAAAVDWVGGVAEGEARVDAEAVAAGGRPAWVAVGPEAVWAAEVAFVETAAGAETVAGVAAVTAVTTAAVAQEVGKVVMEGVVARVVVEVHTHRGVVAVHRHALRLVRRGRLAVHRTTPMTGVGLEALAVPVGIPMGVEGATACRSPPRKVR